MISFPFTWFLSFTLSFLTIHLLLSRFPRKLVIDSSGRLPSGLLTGSLTDLGDYDQCLKISVPSSSPSQDKQHDDRHLSSEREESVIEDETQGMKDKQNQHQAHYPEDESHKEDHHQGYHVSRNAILGNGEENDEPQNPLAKNFVSSSSFLFQGKYCLLRIRPALPKRQENISIHDMILDMEQMAFLKGTVFEDVAKVAHGFYSLPIQIAICIPSTCQSQEVNLMFQKLLTQLSFDSEIASCDVSSHYTFLSSSSSSSDVSLRFQTFLHSLNLFFHELNVYQAISLVIISFLTCLILVASLIDFIRNCSCISKESSSLFNQSSSGKTRLSLVSLSPVYPDARLPPPTQCHFRQCWFCCLDASCLGVMIRSFSIRRNAKRLFVLQTEAGDKLQFIHGTRVLTMAWIIICHTYMFGTQFIPEIASKFPKEVTSVTNNVLKRLLCHMSYEKRTRCLSKN